jgi:16S rRNA (cytosine967-C5)-methyltransferase
MAGVAPARAVAYRVLRRVFEQGAYADRALAGEAAELDARDRALATRIVFGTVQRRDTLDHIAARLLRPQVSDLDAEVLAALRLGLFQLLFLDAVPAHAAVGESVELIKRRNPGGAGRINAVLRLAAREGPALLGELDEETSTTAAVKHSVPRWMAELWWDQRGPDEARALLRVVNEPAESAIRVNPLVSSVPEVSAQLDVPHRAAPELPEGLILDAPLDLESSQLWQAGAITAQARASMLASRILGPQPGERVLDLCAAPGGKTTHLAALMEGAGEVVAVERHAGRAAALERTCRRMRASSVSVKVFDAAGLHVGRPELRGAFDRVLVDPPCSGLGTLRSRPDLRWRVTPDTISELAGAQARILVAAAEAIREGGVLVYSVCTISAAEGVGVIDEFLRTHPGFQAEDIGSEHREWADRLDPRHLQLLPHRDGTDGFFIARLRRRVQ